MANSWAGEIRAALSQPKFRDFLVELLGVRPIYRMAVDRAGEVAGVMPVMAAAGPKGVVLNSLPFFGSNGGVLAATPEVANGLIADFNVMASGPGIAAATIIANPTRYGGLFRVGP